MLSRPNILGSVRLFIIAILCLTGINAKSAENIFDWWPTANSFTISHLEDVTWDGTQFYAVGQAGVILTSVDGRSWFNRGHFSRRSYHHALSFNGKKLFGACSTDEFNVSPIPNGIDLTSADVVDGQLNWKHLNIEMSLNNLFDFAVSDSRIVGLGKNQEGFISTPYQITSSNGLDWDFNQLPGEFNAFTMIEYWKGAYWAFAPSNGQLKTSLDGIQWSDVGLFEDGDNYIATVLKADGDQLLLAGMNGFLARSTDGNIWTSSQNSFNSGFNIRDIHHDNGRYVVSGDSGRLFTSEDSVNWTEVTPDWAKQDWSAISHGNGTWVVVGKNGLIGYSLDGLEWKSTSPDTLRHISSISFSGSTYIATTAVGGWFESENTRHWSGHNFNIPFEVVTAYADESIRLAGGPAGQLACSTNGEPFVEVWTPVSDKIEKIVSGNGLFIAITRNGEMIRSLDGKAWIRNDVSYQSFQDIIFAEGQFTAIGKRDDVPPFRILNSTDGIIWTEALFSTRSDETEHLSGIAYGRGTYVVTGFTRAISSKGHRGVPPIYVSRDFGKTYTLVEITRSNIRIEGVEYFDGRFHAYGQGGFITESEDGINWRPSTGEALTTQDFIQGVSSHNGIVLLTTEGNLLATRRERVNDGPLAEDDQTTLPFGEKIIIDVLENDKDPDGSLNPSSVRIVSQPNGGIVKVLENGRIEYTHNYLFSGNDLFTYTVLDNEGATSNVAGVVISIGDPIPTTYHYPVETLSVDGDLSDWASMLPVGIDAHELRGLDSGLDWRDLYVAHDNHFLYLAYTTYLPAELNWAHNIFIDIDQNSNSGLKFNDMGVDFLIQQGHVYKYNGEDGTTWSWIYLFSATQTQNESVTEIALPRLAIGDPSHLNMTFYAANKAYDAEGNIADDYYPNNGHHIRYRLGLSGENRRPLAHAQTISTFKNRSVEFALKPQDADEQLLTATVVTSPQNGTITLASDSSNAPFTGGEILAGEDLRLTYHPNENHTGIDTFEWIVSDGELTSQVIREEIYTYHDPEEGYYSIPVYNIVADGFDHDWTGIPAVANDGVDIHSSPDWRQVYLANNSHYLLLGTLNQSATPVDWSYNIYLDTDTSRSTGYTGGSDNLAIGVDYMVQGHFLFKYIGSGSDWAWEFIKSLSHGAQNRFVEWKVALVDLGNPTLIHAVFKSEDKTGDNHDYIPNSPESHFLKYKVSFDGLLKTGQNIPSPVDIRPVYQSLITILPQAPEALTSIIPDSIKTFSLELKILSAQGQQWDLNHSADLNEWEKIRTLNINSDQMTLFLPELQFENEAFIEAIPTENLSNK